MFEFFDAFNAYAATHPEILKVMHVLFWLRWWVFVIMMGVFVYMIFQYNRPMVAIRKQEEALKKARRHRFIA